MQPVVSSALGTDNIFFNLYINDTINLAKSIIIKNDQEAIVYNNYIKNYYPSVTIVETDKTTWRYYKHLAGQYHEVDKPIQLRSLDTGEDIILNKITISQHYTTKKELTKYTQMYDTLLSEYPEQELLIKSIISDNTPGSVSEVVDLPNYTILSYSSVYVESNEDNLIPELQSRLYNYSNIWLITYYNNSDNLFLSAQTAILYNYIVTTILAIRQENCKTPQVHSFHLKNYLASNFGLDVYYKYMTRKQAIFLYLNLLYLKNHSGIDIVFKRLIRKLFNDRYISVVNYKYNQISELLPDKYNDYIFRQKLIESSNLPYSTYDFTLDDIKKKESTVAMSNSNYYTFNQDKIDYKLKNTLFNTLLTKDIETLLVDATDSVPYKFIQTLVDNWVYMIKNSYAVFLTKVTDKINNKQIYLNQSDTYKLYVYLLHKVNNITLTSFPPYTITRVYKDTMPNVDDLLKSCYITYSFYKNEMESIVISTPARPGIVYSTHMFSDYITRVYKYDLALWLYLSNLSDPDNFGQFKHMTDSLTLSDIYTPNQEDVNLFLNRIGLSDINNYSVFTLQDMLYSTLNTLYDDKLSFLTDTQNVQEAMTKIFENFKSYTIQFINTYYSQSPILCGPRDTKYKIGETIDTSDVLIENPPRSYEQTYKLLYKYFDDVLPSIQSLSSEESYMTARTTNDFYIKSNEGNGKLILFKTIAPTNIGDNDWVIGQTSVSDLEFLSSNKMP